MPNPNRARTSPESTVRMSTPPWIAACTVRYEQAADREQRHREDRAAHQ